MTDRASAYSPGIGLEEEVAQLYREFGSRVVRRDLRLGGKQIDVYVEEEMFSGVTVRAVIECKDYAGSIGRQKVTEFALVCQLLRNRLLADRFEFVSSNGFTPSAREAADSAGIRLSDIKDLRTRADLIRSQSFLTVLNRTGVISLGQERSWVSSANEYKYTGDPDLLINDRELVGRVKAVAEFIRELERLGSNPTGTVVTVDVTGTATAFANWVKSPLYMAVLQSNSRYVAAYRKRHGFSGIAVQRNFIIEPDRITPEMVHNIEHTLQLHAKLGIASGVLYRGSSIPSDVLADIANFADRVCVDFGQMEGAAPGEARILDILASPGDIQFKRIRERVAWTMESRNLDALVLREDQIGEVIKDLEQRIQRHTRQVFSPNKGAAPDD